MLKLIRQFKEGLRIFKCLSCKREIAIAKNKEIRCIYCGALEDKSIDLPII